MSKLVWKINEEYPVYNMSNLCLLDMIEEKTGEVVGVVVVWSHDIDGNDFKNAHYWDIENEEKAYELIRHTQEFFYNYYW